MAFWLVAILFVATTAVSALLSRQRDVEPSAAGEFQVPVAEEGKTLPVIFGTCIVRDPNVVWWGDLAKNAVKSKVAGWHRIFTLSLLFERSRVLGYQYFIGMQMALCHGVVDQLISIRAGDNDKPIPGVANILPGPTGEAVVDISSNAARDMFGGTIRDNPTGEGGLKGRLRFYSGKEGQPSNAYLASQIGQATAPAYSGVCQVVLERSSITKGWPFYVGTNPVIKKWAFVLRRCPNNLGLTAGHNIIGGWDANPAEIAYEIMTNPVWGLGIPSARFNLTSWRAAGETLWTEGMGMSIKVDEPTSGDQLLGEIARHVDGVFYTDPATGLWEFKLARADYDPNTLLEITQDDVLEAPELTRGSWEETLNEIKIKFTNRTTFKDDMVQAQETANHAVRGEIASDTISFKGFTSAAIAQKVAVRELKIHSYPLAKARIVANRKAWNLRIGSVFKLTFAPYGITGMVLRVGTINYGDLANPRIEVEAVEDIFNVAFTAYDPPADSGWVDPVSDPLPPLAQVLEEMPYHLTDEAERKLIVAAVRAEDQSDGYQVWSDEGQGYYHSNDEGPCPSATLRDPYPRTTLALDTVGFVIQGGRDLPGLENTDAAGRVRGENLLLIGEEWMSWTTAADNGDGTWTVAGIVRGIFDTIPTDHAAGERVWFISDGGSLARPDPYPIDLAVSAKCLPYSHRGVVPIENVSPVTKTMASRAQKPYPPGKAQVNGLYWPTDVVGDAAFTWAHRIRTAQPNVVQQDAASVAGTIEGTYTVEVLLDGVVQGSRTQTGLTGTSFTYTLAQYLADAPSGKAVQFRITPINGLLQGTVRTTDAFWFGGFGLNFGRNFGGMNKGA
ncbi:MAG TPA: phage tail protein [Terriglobales bacterium]|nr:phage tail protein [Terriglobales bacterium]